VRGSVRMQISISLVLCSTHSTHMYFSF
jgi:hypothetical protein